jgi:ParB family transcriptional regulator, chromosome partitioning protein
MSRRTGLGRGLDALIPGDTQPRPGGVQEVLVDMIDPNPRQPRQQFDPQELAELAASIREHGILQPLILTVQQEVSDRYTLIAGHRRLLAARQAGLQTVPAVVREASEQQRLEMAIVENVQRIDLNPLEQAQAFHLLSEEFGLSHEQIAERVGKSRPVVTNRLRLLGLPEDVRKALADGEISEGHARALLALLTTQAQSAALATILHQGLNVRQAEELVRHMLGERHPKLSKPLPPAEIIDLEERFRRRLGTKVRLSRRGKNGTLTIFFYSDEELDALIQHLLGDDS